MKRRWLDGRKRSSTSRRGNALIYWLILVAIFSYIAWFTIILGAQEYVIFVRALHPAPFWPVERPEVESVWLTMPDGVRVEAWYSPGVGRSAVSPGPAVMYFHGNGNIIDTKWLMVQPYIDGGVSALTMEYRGYGRTGGVPSYTRLVADAVAFHDWLALRPEVLPQKIIFDGQSIGGAMAAALAGKRRPVAMILESTFTSMEDIGRRFLLPSWTTRMPFHTEDVLSRLEIPVLICHGRNDGLIPLEQALRLHAAARNAEFVIIEHCGHSDFKSDWGVILGFLKRNRLWPGE